MSTYLSFWETTLRDERAVNIHITSFKVVIKIDSIKLIVIAYRALAYLCPIAFSAPNSRQIAGRLFIMTSLLHPNCAES